MQDIDTAHASTPHDALYLESPRDARRGGSLLRRTVFVSVVLLAVVLLTLLPPLLNVNRFKRQIVTSISSSLGRPVHLDNVTLILLPVPGFKLENFVVAEDAAFGSEPVIHANSVEARLRFSSLWRRKVEFSKISLFEPSINLVHRPDGVWNLESILLQAARIPAAPTAQTKAGPEPRFPYIEATDARVNVKEGLEKLPFSFTDADIALWLPEPQQWRIRLKGKPTRTDTSASDTGTISLEGTLGHADRFASIPINVAAEWKNAPLGEASRVITGSDAGVRGTLRWNLTMQGTMESTQVKSTLLLNDARRADFVPEHALDVRADCQATASASFHVFHEIRCSWPSPSSSILIAATGDIPSIHNLNTASFEVGTPSLPAATLLNWLRVASPRVPLDVSAAGALSGSISHEPGQSGEAWSGLIRANEVSLTSGTGDDPITLGDTVIQTEADKCVFTLAPATLELGAKDPATISGTFDRAGYSLHLAGNIMPSRLLALAADVPQFGDGLATELPAPPAKPAPKGKESPVHIDLTSQRAWGGPQIWTRAATRPASAPAKSWHRHRG